MKLHPCRNDSDHQVATLSVPLPLGDTEMCNDRNIELKTKALLQLAANYTSSARKETHGQMEIKLIKKHSYEKMSEGGVAGKLEMKRMGKKINEMP